MFIIYPLKCIVSLITLLLLELILPWSLSEKQKSLSVEMLIVCQGTHISPEHIVLFTYSSPFTFYEF